MDLPDVYMRAQSLRAKGPRAEHIHYISGKLHNLLGQIVNNMAMYMYIIISI